MELVEGPTLADRIAQGPIPIDEALPIAKQIAEALEAAHGQSIIHRDLKPANIKLRPDSIVKVLDFGLAKLTPAANFGSQPEDLSHSPTNLSPAATALGVIMGTAAYMSPEQARGMSVDKQTDIWSFGAVLFEMLSGRAAFAGGTFSDTIARILERDPDWHALPASTPERIRALLRRCLQKEQHRRIHDIADARIEIEEVHTALRARRGVILMPAVVAAVALAAASVIGVWWHTSRSVPPIPHEPVSVLIADFQNQTGDPTFDRSLESVLKLALEGAGFITAYDRTGVRAVGGVPPDRLDERSALEVAVKQGLAVVISGSVNRDGPGYEISVKAMQAVSGNLLTSVAHRAAGKDQVLAAATEAAIEVRSALGDNTSDSVRRFAMETLSATSLEVVRDYAVAMQALSNADFDGARQNFLKALQRDPNFGLAYATMAITLWNRREQQEAEKYAKEALRHLDRMTERERYRARGIFYMVTGDHFACAREFGDLIARYSADVGAHNNLALCATKLRNLPNALDMMQRVTEILPRRALYRVNLALYASYASDFERGEREAMAALDLGSALGLQPLAFAHVGRGDVAGAADIYRKFASPLSPSDTTSGLGDLAVYQGRFSEAIRLLEQGAAADDASNSPERAAAKLTAIANAQLLRGQPSSAIAAAEKALAHSSAVKIRFLAARVFVETGAVERALPLRASLAAEINPESQAYAKIVEGEVALKDGDAVRAITLLIEANSLLDTWVGRFALGRAYLDSGQYTQADSEFDRCIKRSGEALALFLDEEPTYGYFPSVYYYQGRVREALGTSRFAESYRTYLSIREEAGEDPLLPEVRRRVGP